MRLPTPPSPTPPPEAEAQNIADILLFYCLNSKFTGGLITLFEAEILGIFYSFCCCLNSILLVYLYTEREKKIKIYNIHRLSLSLYYIQIIRNTDILFSKAIAPFEGV